MAYLQWRKRSICDWEPAAYGTSAIATVFNVGVGDLVGAAFIRITEAFNGTGGDATVGVGDGGARARFIATATADVANTGVKQGVGAGFATCPGYLYTNTDTIDINYVEDTTDNSTTTGICDVWIYVAQAYPF